MATAYELTIPGLNILSLVDRPNKTYLSNNRPNQLRLSYLNIVFNDADGTSQSPEEQVRQLRRNLDKVNDFYLENSYGRFQFGFKIRTAILDKPRSWRGNATATPIYGGPDHTLTNPDAFPSEKDYTGFEDFNIHSKDPQLYGDDWKINALHRRYVGSSHRNIVIAAIKSATSTSYNWDDSASMSDWLDYGFPPGDSGALLAFSSLSVPGAGVRKFLHSNRNRTGGTYAPITTEDIGLPNRVIRDYVYVGGESIRSDVQAHELGHTLGLSDYYPKKSYKGYLGEASMMGSHLNFPHLDAVSKFRLGWLDPIVLEPNEHARKILLAPVYENPQSAILIWPDKYTHEHELFMVEVRHKDHVKSGGTAVEFDTQLPDTLYGVLVYHINAKPGASVNAPQHDIEGEKPKSLPGSEEITALRRPLRSPDTNFYDGADSGLEIEVTDVKPDGTHEILVTWNRKPKLCAAGTFLDGQTHVVARGISGRPFYKRLENGQWFPSQMRWEELGGSISGVPSATITGAELNLFVKGEISSRVFHKSRFEQSWSPSQSEWDNLHGGITDGPDSVRLGAWIHVFVRGESGNVFVKYQERDGWLPSRRNWKNLGGPTMGSPRAVDGGDMGLHLFSRDPSGKPLHKVFLANEWSPSLTGWHQLGGRIDADVGCVRTKDNVHLLVRGISGKVFHKRWDGEQWHPSANEWESLGGEILGPPAVASYDVDNVFVFVTGKSGGVFCKRWNGNSWQAEWTSLGGQVLDSPCAISEGQNRICLLVTGISGKAFYKRLVGSWYPSQTGWIDLGGQMG